MHCSISGIQRDSSCIPLPPPLLLTRKVDILDCLKAPVTWSQITGVVILPNSPQRGLPIRTGHPLSLWSPESLSTWSMDRAYPPPCVAAGSLLSRGRYHVSWDWWVCRLVTFSLVTCQRWTPSGWTVMQSGPINS